MTLKEKIIEGLEELSTDELLSLCSEINSYDGNLDQFDIFEMDEFDGMLSGKTPTEIACSILYGDFSIDDEYFRFNAYDNLESLSYADIEEELANTIGEIADYIDSNTYYNLLPDSIKLILDEFDEEE